MKSKSIITPALIAAVMTSIAAAPAAEAKSKEKCYGVSKAGKNDCASLSGSHSCAAQSTKDNDPEEWVFVPTGLCERLTGGKTN